MKRNDFEWNAEKQWLEDVLKEARKQLNEERDMKERFKKDALEMQRELWQDLGALSITNGLEQIVGFMEYIGSMKRQKRSHEFARKLEEKYERMLLSPYFGRIDFQEKGEVKAEKYYIGISNLINDDYDFLVYDWRAPVSSMFYDYEMGEANYKCPEGTVEGEISLKRQYKIYNGDIEYMFDSNLKIDDEILQNILGKSTDSKMKAIVTTIQREQNRVIRNEEYKNLIVQGPAGSGKTSVALHRIAYLLYKHRETITPRNIVIFSPNEIFNDYISNVLPQLGEENMGQTTFKDYMHKALGSEHRKENYSEMMEYILSFKSASAYGLRINNIKYKASMEFIDVLKYYVNYLETMDRGFYDIVYKGKTVISSEEINELFYRDYKELPLKRRLNKLRERILFLLQPYEKKRVEEVNNELDDSEAYFDDAGTVRCTSEARRGIDIVKEEMKGLYEEIQKVTEFNLMDLYKRLFENLEMFYKDLKMNYDDKIESIRRYTLKSIGAERVNYEEQPPLLYLKGALGDQPKTAEIKYVIIDEAQDYTPLQYEIFNQLFSHANMTILGDLNQSINPYMNVGSYDNISKIFPENNTALINLTKSYRSTMEITRFSRKLLNREINDECVERSGEEPILVSFQDERAIKQRLLQDIKHYKGRGYNSIGIITRTAREADEVFKFLKYKVNVKAIMKDDDEFVNDTLVIPAYLSKGLEFDVVLIYNAGEENYSCEEERLLFYTACTRALHALCIYYTGRCTPLLKGKNVEYVSK